MSIQIRLYGDLRKKVQQQSDDDGAPSIINIENEGIETVSDILKKISIEESEVSHIFVACKYSGIGKKIRIGDRVALFPKNTGLLYKWYFNKEEND